MDKTNSKTLLASFYQDKNGRLELTDIIVGDLTTAIYADQYDVDWCKRDGGYCYHMSGSGPFRAEVSGIYYAASGISVDQKPCALADKSEAWWNKTRAIRVPAEFNGLDILEWLEINGRECQTVWCSICKDSLPDEELCEHIWWCDSCGTHSTPDEPIGCLSVECDCVYNRKLLADLEANLAHVQ